MSKKGRYSATSASNDTNIALALFKRHRLPFVPGRLYRKAQIHQVYGGQNQRGISTPKNKSYIFLFTNPQHEVYTDRWTRQGYFRYQGEGISGNCSVSGGNKALMLRKNCPMHVFQQAEGAGIVIYVGVFHNRKQKVKELVDSYGETRKTLVFYLKPLYDEIIPTHVRREMERINGLQRRSNLKNCRRKAFDNFIRQARKTLPTLNNAELVELWYLDIRREVGKNFKV